jgi:alcohol oxidase
MRDAPRRKYFVFGYLNVRTILSLFNVVSRILQAYPVSAGRVHINSGLNAYAPLDFEPGILDELAALPFD